MVKVLQIGMCEKGGVETLILNHYNQIDLEQYSFDFVRMIEHIAYEREIESLGGHIYSVANSRKSPLCSLYEIRNLITKNGYDVVHIHISHFADIVPLLAAKISGCKHIILHAHNNGMEGRLQSKLHALNRLITSQMKIQRLACSKSAGKWMFGKASFDIFENAIPTHLFYYNEKMRKKMRKDLNLSDDSFVIGTVGRLDPQKNQSFLIHTFAQYVRTNPNAYLLIVGSGALEGQLHRLVYNLDLGSKVIFTGFQEAVAPYYQAMDAFCLPSLYEGFGIAGIEAQMSGLPCIFSKFCVDEVDISQKSIFLLLDEISWVNQLEQIQLQQNQWDRNIYPSGYDVKENVKKLEKLYSKRI